MVGEWLMETTELMAQFIALYQVCEFIFILKIRENSKNIKSKYFAITKGKNKIDVKYYLPLPQSPVEQSIYRVATSFLYPVFVCPAAKGL